jgi:hypothetical protein
VWSTLEYACHVRDVFRLYDRRLALMLDEDDATFARYLVHNSVHHMWDVTQT